MAGYTLPNGLLDMSETNEFNQLLKMSQRIFIHGRRETVCEMVRIQISTKQQESGAVQTKEADRR